MRHIVEKVLAHYQNVNNKPGYDRARSICLYRTKDGNHCAVGCLFGESEIQKLREVEIAGEPFDLWACESSIQTLRQEERFEKVWEAIKECLKVETSRGLILLQEIHDNVASTIEDPEKAREALVAELEQVLSGRITDLRNYNSWDWSLVEKKQELHHLL